MIVYPDSPLSLRELKLMDGLGVSFQSLGPADGGRTVMRNPENRWGATIAISTPESPDLTGFGTTMRHMAPPMEVMAIHLLSFGSGLPWGGNPRQRGATERLFELVDRCDGSRLLGADRVAAYLPWPACATLLA